MFGFMSKPQDSRPQLRLVAPNESSPQFSADTTPDSRRLAEPDLGLEDLSPQVGGLSVRRIIRQVTQPPNGNFYDQDEREDTGELAKVIPLFAEKPNQPAD